MLTLHSTGLAMRRRRAAALRAAATRFVAWCLACHARAEQRRDLAQLDERLLKDVGITRVQAAEEGAKPWWRA